MFILVALAVLIPGLYLQQNRSGKRAWQKCRHELEAKGEVLDWDAYIPANVPNQQNIFAVPKMSDWFVKRTPMQSSGPLVGRINSRMSGGQPSVGDPIEIACLTLHTNGSALADPKDKPDLILCYDAPNLGLVPEHRTETPAVPAETIPLILMDDVPLSEAIRFLAGRANLRYVIDPDVFPKTNNGSPQQPSVSIRWENVTARVALKALLNNYSLALVNTGDAQTVRIAKQDLAKPRIFVDAQTRQAISVLLQQTLAPLATVTQSVTLSGPQGFTFVKEPLGDFKPVHFAVHAPELPSLAEIAAFFRAGVISPDHATAGDFRIKHIGTNIFSATIEPSVYTAQDYLDWSDQFAPEFDIMREALKRSSARIAGDYREPFQMPFQNFVAIRAVMQLLSQRAQCALLLDHPEEALRDLTLLHDLSRLLNATPSEKAATVVAAMINAAITGVYVQTIADGLRLHAWHEPQLIALQRQLKDVDLMPSVLDSFRAERAAVCRTFENAVADGKCGVIPGKPPNRSVWQKIRDPDYWFFTYAPRGWVYQNMITVAQTQQKILDSYDPALKTIRARNVDKVGRDFEKACSHCSPKTFLAAIAVPNYSRACKNAAFTQTRVNEAFVACALERYRLSNTGYPDKLAALLPSFVQTLPADLINGQPLHYVLQKDGSFLLYSVGWNETDDSGSTTPTKTGTPNPESPDWAWLSM